MQSSSDDELAKAPDVPPKGELMVIVVASVASSDIGPSSTRVYEHLARLKAVVANILENQARILQHLNHIQQTLDEDVTLDSQAALTPNTDT